MFKFKQTAFIKSIVAYCRFDYLNDYTIVLDVLCSEKSQLFIEIDSLKLAIFNSNRYLAWLWRILLIILFLIELIFIKSALKIKEGHLAVNVAQVSHIKIINALIVPSLNIFYFQNLDITYFNLISHCLIKSLLIRDLVVVKLDINEFSILVL